MIIKKLIISILVILSTVSMVGLPRLRAEDSSTEYKIKAAFLYNFLNFIEWPSGSFKDSNDVLKICVIGEDPFGDSFETFINKTIKGKKLEIYQINKIGDTDNCHIAFISSSEKRRLGRVLADLNGSSTLTVSDIKSFTQEGGIINFVTVENRIGFEINIKAAERSGLKISSKLLNLAKTIYDK